MLRAGHLSGSARMNPGGKVGSFEGAVCTDCLFSIGTARGAQVNALQVHGAAVD